MRKMSSFLTMLVFASVLAVQGLYAEDLPVQISDGSNEYWYYAQFNRSKVFYGEDVYITGGAIGTNLSQSPLVSGNPEQQWKFTGTTDGYQMVNKAGKVVKYDGTADYTQGKYQSADATQGGTLLGFRVYSGGSPKTANNKTFEVSGYMLLDISLNKALNDQNRATVCPYGTNGHDNIINFIPAAAPYISASLNALPFAEVLQGASREKTLKVTGLDITGNITANVTGTDAAAFDVDLTTLPAAGGELTVTFSPTGKQQYEATLELTATGAAPVVIPLSGRSDFDLPLTISDDDNEYWYYITSARAAAVGKVITGPTAIEDRINLADFDASDTQQWKIIGDWDNYELVSRTEFSLQYNTTTKVYEAIDEGLGDLFSFEAFNGSLTSWQLKDIFVEGTTQCYLNQSPSWYMTAYSKNDAGAELVFISSTEPALLAPSSWDAGTVFIGETPVKKNLIITKVNTTEAISASVSGQDTDAFAAELSGDTLKLTYTPNHSRKQTAVVTITAGSASRNITLTGSAIGIPVFTPEGAGNDDSYWYLVQYNRQALPTQSTQSHRSWHWDSETGKVLQTTLGTDSLNTDRWFKFVGDPFDFKILGWDNKVARVDPERLILSAEGDADMLTFYQEGEARFSIKDKNQTNKFLNDNGGTEVGVYSYHDAGAPLIFTEIPGKTYPASTTTVERAPLPIFSTPEEPIFYVIQFERTATKAAPLNTNVWTWTDDGLVIQEAIETDTTNIQQWWYFVGDKDSFKIRTYEDAGELAYDSTSTEAGIPRNYYLESVGEGDSHSLVRASKWAHWSVMNLTGVYTDPDDGDYTYVNDYEGNADAIGLYLDGDGGNPVIFTLVPGQTIPNPPTGIHTVNPIERVVAVKYYNLQGVEVAAPTTSTATGVYIVRKVLESGKAQSQKIVHVAQ